MKGQLGLSLAQDLRDDKVTGKSQQSLLNPVLGFSREIESEKETERDFKELANVIMEAEKSQNLQSAS